MWTIPFTDELSVLYKQAGVDEELPTSNMEVVHTSTAERDLATNYGGGKYFTDVERNLPTNNAKESVQGDIERNLPTNNMAESVRPPIDRGLEDNYMGKSAKLHSFWKATKELPDAFVQMQVGRKSYQSARKIVKERTRNLKQPIASSTYRKAKSKEEAALKHWSGAGKRVARGLVIPGGVAATGAIGGVAYKSRKKKR